MSCTCTSNTYKKDYTAIKGSTLIIAGSMSANGVPMNLTGYEFKLEISTSVDFLIPSIADSIATISGSSYTFNTLLSIDKANYYYRVSYKDSLGRLYPEALRQGKIIITE